MTHIAEFEKIPNFAIYRAHKDDYREEPIDHGSVHFDDPLVAVSEYGVPGVEYWSRPNGTLDHGVEGVSPDIFVRRMVAEKLASVNEALQGDDDVAELLGRRVGIMVDSGFRSPPLQSVLFDPIIPELLRSKHPDESDEEVLKRRDKAIAIPGVTATYVPPHSTGAAVDVAIIDLESGQKIDIVKGGTDPSNPMSNPEAVEKLFRDDIRLGGRVEESVRLARNVRRVLYHAMTDPEIGGLAFAQHPGEAWHYSYGDQMWSWMYKRDAAIFGLPLDIPERINGENVRQLFEAGRSA